jgi:hypothetical protein
MQTKHYRKKAVAICEAMAELNMKYTVACKRANLEQEMMSYSIITFARLFVGYSLKNKKYSK